MSNYLIATAASNAQSRNTASPLPGLHAAEDTVRASGQANDASRQVTPTTEVSLAHVGEVKAGLVCPGLGMDGLNL